MPTALIAALLFSPLAQAPLDVTAYGAKPDGKTDCTAAFQKALDQASKEGQVVFAPRGNYLFKGHLNVPGGVTLKGIWESVPAHNGVRDKGLPLPTDDGTTFLVTGSAGTEAGPPFVTLNTNSTLKGVVLYYPDQLPTPKTESPTPYPYAIAMRGKNPAVLDVELLNPYNGIDATQNERHLIRNVQGQPLRRGIFVDAIYDIGRIENVHFNPWWSMQPKLLQWQMANGEAFVFGRTDWQYVLNTFCFGYKIGYRFIETKNGVCNGNFLGIGADDCWTAIQVDQCAPMGLLITNGEFVSFHGPDPTMVRIGVPDAVAMRPTVPGMSRKDAKSQSSAKNPPRPLPHLPAHQLTDSPLHPLTDSPYHPLTLSPFSGSVRFSNCAFWGPSNQIARIDGNGTVGFSDCTFVQWDSKNEGRPALQADGGTLLVRGCEFREAKNQVRLGSNVKRAVITGNVLSGPARMENKSSGKVVIGDNMDG